MTNEPVITALEAAPFACRGGIKTFCESSGLDYLVFLRDGYPVSVLRAVGCSVADAVFDKVLAQREGGSDGRQ